MNMDGTFFELGRNTEKEIFAARIKQTNPRFSHILSSQTTWRGRIYFLKNAKLALNDQNLKSDFDESEILMIVRGRYCNIIVLKRRRNRSWTLVNSEKV